MERSAFKQWLLAGVLVLVYAVTLLVVWIVSTSGSVERLDGLMASCAETAIDDVDYNVEPEALRVARIFVTECGDLEHAAKADLDDAIRRFGCEEINVIGTNNIIVAAAEPKYIGFNMADKPETAEFVKLNTGERKYVTQHFRLSRCGRTATKGGMGLWLKYVGLPFPGGGCVQIGESYRDFRTRFSHALECLMQNTDAGENGYYLLADRDRKTVISGYRAEWTNWPLTKFGLDPETFRGDEILKLSVLGVKSYVRRVRLDFTAMDVYVVIPFDDILTVRNRTFALIALVLGLILLVGGILFCKVIRQHERIEDLYAREAERVEKDMAMAKAIQVAALPARWPDDSAIDLFAVMRTAKQVGGDFYDFFELSGHRLCIVCADVSDKGIPAAMFMMKSKAVLRAAVESHAELRDAVAEANASLCAGNEGANMFVTAWIARLDLASGRLEYVNAGHNPPFVRRADGTVECLRARHGLVLAAADAAKYRSGETTLGKDETLLLYTDGVTEAVSSSGELFGEARLERLIASVDRSARDLCTAIQFAVDGFSAGMPQADDITILALRARG